MSSDKSTVAETLILLDGNDRYINHVEIDRQWKAHPRSGERAWFYGIFPFGRQSVAVVRTFLQGGDRAGVGASWKEVDMQKMIPDSGVVDGYVVIAPHKARHRSAFLSDKVYAEKHIASRLGGYGEVLSVHAFDAEKVRINKPGSEFSVQSRLCRFTLKTDKDRAAQLLTRGIGGCKAFGLGCVVLSGSTLFSMIDDVSGF